MIRSKSAMLFIPMIAFTFTVYGNQSKAAPDTAKPVISIADTPPIQKSVGVPAGAKPQQILASDQQTTNIVLPTYPRNTVSGKIFDKESLEPLANVDLISDSGTTLTRTSSDGTFHIDNIITSFYLIPKLKGYAPFNGYPRIAPQGKNSNIEIAMAPSVTVSGKITTPEGTPVTGATVRVEGIVD